MGVVFSTPFAHVCIDILNSALISIGTMSVVLTIMILIEARVPHAQPPAPPDVSFNVRYATAAVLIGAIFQPLLVVIPLAITRALGAGWVSFPAGAFGWWLAFVAVLATTDLFEYVFHRAQHAFTALWSMHELHHSASHFNATISYRHFWAEALIKLAFLYPLVGVIFRAPPGVGTAVALVFAVNHQVAHMNLRFEPRFKCLVNHPQYHRLHHSNASRDANINFADLFPMWDFIFGTMRRPAPSEWVDVGLHDDRAPKTVLQGILWPWYRKRQSATAPFPDTT